MGSIVMGVELGEFHAQLNLTRMVTIQHFARQSQASSPERVILAPCSLNLLETFFFGFNNFGRRTYEQSLTFGEWPYPGKLCWVFSRHLREAAQPEVITTAQSPDEIVATLQARGVRRAWLVGGGNLAAAFMAPGPREHLWLIESRSYPNGVMQLRYMKTGNAGETVRN